MEEERIRKEKGGKGKGREGERERERERERDNERRRESQKQVYLRHVSKIFHTVILHNHTGCYCDTAISQRKNNYQNKNCARIMKSLLTSLHNQKTALNTPTRI